MKSKSWRLPLWCLAGGPVGMLLFSSLLLTGGRLDGFESYHDPDLNDAGYCADCHPGFGGGQNDTLHARHTGGSDPITNNCNLCHTGSGRNNPLTMWSVGEAGIQGLGCAGCHGRDYGETVTQDYRGLGTLGAHKNSGHGLRLHHAINEVDLCYDCHNDNVTPYPENVINPGLGHTVHYYFLDDVNLGGKAVDPCANEDTGNDPDGLGLDNDGDGLYDAADPDCVVDPGALAITGIDPLTGSFTLSWPTPSSDWRLQQNPLLEAAGWVDAAAPNRTQRVNGRWTVELPATDGVQFYRLTDSP